MALEAAVVTAASYVLGSVPFGLIAGLWLKGVDIRQHGSGNIGASNVLRLLGWPSALVVLLLDAAKGFLPVWIAKDVLSLPPVAVVSAAVAAIVGHSCSVFLKFKGGKGVATSLGVLLGLSPVVAAAAVGIWLLVVGITRYISAGSMVAGVAIPCLMYYIHDAAPRRMPIEYVLMAAAAGAFIVIRHRSNIGRLMTGTETRIGQRVPVEAEKEASDAPR